MIENSMLYRGIPKNKSDYEFLSKAYPENCKNGFVFGQPLIDKVKNRYYICVSLLATMNCTVANGTVTVIEVIPDTINRCMELTDKNGTQFFEGDIVKIISLSHDTFYAVVKFGDYNQPDKILRTHLGFYFDFFNDVNHKCFRKDVGYWTGQTFCDFEIIGNIYDNQVLLKGE